MGLVAALKAALSGPIASSGDAWKQGLNPTQIAMIQEYANATGKDPTEVRAQLRVVPGEAGQ